MQQYYTKFAAAFIRGRSLAGGVPALSPRALQTPLEELSAEEMAEIVSRGREAGLRLRKFKRAIELPRVRRVLGALQGLQPASLLDIGSGRGTFLWPLLETFPDLPVTVIDAAAQRFEDLQATRSGGLERISPRHADATDLPFEDREFDVVTILEVLEHIPAAESALAEVCRVADRFVVLSVPSKEDDNPEHIHLFDQERLRQMFADCGVARVSFDYVPGHLIAVANRAG